MTATKAPEPLLAQIRAGERFLLTSHVHPDGDAIGSELGLARLLRTIGKGVTIWNRDLTPSIYRPLPGQGLIQVGDTPPDGFPEQFSAVIVLECPSLDRCGLASQLGALPILNIDHHLGNDQYGQVNWIDTSAPAVGEMVLRLARALHLELDADTATLLFLTLVTDTGGFRFSNATAEAFDAAAALVREGARPEQVSHWLYESQPIQVLRLVGETLRTVTLHHQGRIATAALSRQMMADAGAGDGDSEGLIDYPRSIAGVEAVALLRQVDEGSHKVSLRSRGELDVESVARRFGGGGHRNAAGYTRTGSADTLREEAVAALTELLPG